MHLLADENIAPSLIRRIRGLGHDILSVKESMGGADDSAILARAFSEHRVLLTFDKDFGELAFRSLLPASCGVILIRMTPRGRETDIDRVASVISSRSDWAGAFWVITDQDIRRRPLPEATEQ